MNKRQLIIAFVVLSMAVRLQAVAPDFTYGGTFTTAEGNTMVVPPQSEWTGGNFPVSGTNLPTPPPPIFRGYATSEGLGIDRSYDGGNTWGGWGFYLYSAMTFTGNPGPTPTPTPTPTPSPTPDPNSVGNIETGDIGEPVPDGFAATVIYTMDDNGEMRFADVVSSDGTYQIGWLNSDSGRTYTKKLVIWPLDVEHPPGSHTDPVNVLDMGTGVVPPQNITPPVVVAPTPSSQFQYKTIGSVVKADGTVANIQSVSGAAGTSTVIPSVKGTVVIAGAVAGSGPNGQFVPSSSDATDINLNDIKNLLREANIQRDIQTKKTEEGLTDINETLQASASPTASPTPTATPTPSPTPEEETEVVGTASDFTAASGWPTAEQVNFNAPSSSVSWVITFPGSGATHDFNPRNFPWFLALAAWIKMIIWWLITIWITYDVYRHINSFIQDAFRSLEGADVHRLTGATEKKGWISTILGHLPVYGFVKSTLTSLFWKSAIISAVVIFVGLVGGQFLTFQGMGAWIIGGNTLFQSLATAILPSHPALVESVALLCLFIPFDHALNCGAIWLASHALRPVASFALWLYFRFL